MNGSLSLGQLRGILWPGSWRADALGVATIVVWILFWYHETAAAMITIWVRSDTFMHCFLIPPIVLWMAWRQRDALSERASSPEPRTLLLFGLAGFAWLLGELAAVNAVTQLSLMSMLILAVPAICGFRLASAIALPLMFLFFAVPIGEFGTATLMEWTANFTVFALRLSGIPVYREGLQFVLPSGNWSVVEACSGIRYLIASVTVGTLFAYLNFHSAKRRVAFIVVAALVPIVANWLRAYGIVMIGHLSGNKLAVGVDHLIYGWLFFGVIIMLMFMIGARWADDAPLPSRAHVNPATATKDTIRFPWLTAGAVLLVTALPVLWNSAIEQRDSGRAVRLVMQEGRIGQWEISRQPPVDWVPAFQNPSAQLHLGLANAGATKGLFLGYYQNQGHGRKLISSENMLVRSKDARWAQVSRGSREINLEGRILRVNTAELRGGGLQGSGAESRIVVWQWYWVNGLLTSNDYRAKAEIAFLRLLGRPDASAVVVLYAPKSQADDDEAGLQLLIEAIGGSIDAALRRARDSS